MLSGSVLQNHCLEIGDGLEVEVTGNEDGAMFQRLRGKPDVIDGNRRAGRS